MNRKAEYFERYEALAAVSGRMLGAARSADWSALPELQAEFMQLVDGLRRPIRASCSTNRISAASST